MQYNVALGITGAIRGTSQSKLYNELGLNLKNLEDGLDEAVLSLK